MRNQHFLPVLLAGLLMFGLGTAVSAQSGNPAGGPGTQKTKGNLLQMSKLSNDHTTLMMALKAVSLEKQARGAAKYTVFAPINTAFDKLPAGMLNNILKPTRKGQLAVLLLYHVVRGSYLTANLTNGQRLTTMLGGTLTVVRRGNSVMIKDARGHMATVIQADIVANNGVIQSVDAVLMPTSLFPPI